MQPVTTYLPAQATTVLIASNPKAGSGVGRRKVQQLQEMLAERGFDAQVLIDRQQLAERAAETHGQGKLRCVVAAGGDGTVSMVANQIPRGAAFSVLPLGTENLFAKHLGIVASPTLVADIVQSGVTVSVDAGQVGDRIFLLMFSCGFDAEVVQRLHNNRTGNIRHVSYVKPIVQSIRSYGYPELVVDCGADAAAITAKWAFVFNFPCYAFGLRIAPQAVATDGMLDVCTFRQGSLWKGLTYLSGVLLGRHRSWKDCVTQTARHIRIEADGQVPYELDGDPAGYLPVEIDILPGRLPIVVPEPWALDHASSTIHS